MCVQTDLPGVTIHNAVGLIIIISLGLGLWLVFKFMAKFGLKFRVVVSVFDRVT